MRLLDFAIKAGWPISTDTFEWLQNQMLQLQYGSLLGGSNYILQGCTVNNNIVTDGWIVVNGEVLPFKGGALQTNVIITDVPTTREFFGGAQNNYYHERTAIFGTGIVQYPWSSFRRNDPANGVLARLDKVEKMLKPLIGYSVNGNTVYGSWLFWGRPAAEIPAGWEAVPDDDWKGRVPVVMDTNDFDFDTIGEIGGSKTATLLRTNLPHTKLPVTVPASAVATGDTGDGRVAGGSDTNSGVTSIAGLETDYLGDGTPLKIEPKYKVVMFIRFVG